MWVQMGDDLKTGHWVDIPEPDSFPANGLTQIGNYVSRLLGSSAPFRSIIIATPDEQTAVLLWQRGEVPEISLSLEWRSESVRERDLRKFFSKRSLSISHD